MSKRKADTHWIATPLVPNTYDVYVVTVNPGGNTISSQWYVTKARFDHHGWNHMGTNALYGSEEIAAWAVIEIPKPYEGEKLPAANT